jgi:hypothetical protein
MAPYAIKMLGGSVTFMFRKCMGRIGLLAGLHDSVPGYLRNDAGGRDTQAGGIPGNDRRLRDGKWMYRQTVDQCMLHNVVDFLLQMEKRPAHGEVSRTQDIQLIDFLSAGFPHRPEDLGMPD